MLLILKFLLFSLSIGCLYCEEFPIILPPQTSNGPEVALLIVKGANINETQYQPLGEAIQNDSLQSIWIGLVGPFNNTLTTGGTSENIDLTLGKMRSMGMTTDLIFLAGHSKGGVTMQPWIHANTNSITGIILLGSESLVPLANLNLSMQNVVGDLDGLMPTRNYLSSFQELESLVENDEEYMFRYPLSILIDVNHFQYASGDVPTLIERDDILSPLSEAEAHRRIAEHINAFMVATTGLPIEAEIEARNQLKLNYEYALLVMDPLKQMNALSYNEEGSVPWTVEAQKMVSSCLDLSKLNIQDQFQPNRTLFEEVQPTYTVEGDTMNINTVSYYYWNLNMPQYDDLASKTKSRDAIMKELEPLGVPFGNQISCKYINEASLDLALNISTPLVISRYESRGKQLIMAEDEIVLTGPSFLASSISYTYSDTEIIITSPSLITDILEEAEKAGMHYCKLLSPWSTLQFLMSDSLRGTLP